MKETIKRVNCLHKKVHFFFLGSVDEHGLPNIKAVLPTKKRENIHKIYFSTNTSSRHVQQYKNNPIACVYFFSPFFYKGVLLKGEMEIIEELSVKEIFWNKGDEKYYPKGVADPDYCILRFTAKSGRYYYHYKSTDFVINLSCY